jgi:hypothetical protein
MALLLGTTGCQLTSSPNTSVSSPFRPRVSAQDAPPQADPLAQRALRARTDCTYGEDACSPCVNDLLSSLDSATGGVDISGRDARIEIAGYEIGESVLHHHIQGVARLADLIHRDGTRTGRIILTDNLSRSGLSYAEGEFETGRDSIFAGGRYTVVRNVNLRQYFEHPGGAQAHGNTMVVSMDSRRRKDAAAYFLHFPPHGKPKLISGVGIDGTHGEPILSSRQRWSASSAAFIQLDTGEFLVAVSGDSHGKAGIWFFLSSNDVIDASTRWQYVGSWTPCTGDNGDGDLERCFAGASGMALLADCSGDIFLVTLHGTSQARQEYQWIQVFQLGQEEGGTLKLALRSWQRDHTGRLQRNNPAFRWAGGAFVTDEPDVVALLNTVRDPATSPCMSMCGDVYWSKPRAVVAADASAFSPFDKLAEPEVPIAPYDLGPLSGAPMIPLSFEAVIEPVP